MWSFTEAVGLVRTGEGTDGLEMMILLATTQPRPTAVQSQTFSHLLRQRLAVVLGKAQTGPFPLLARLGLQ